MKSKGNDYPHYRKKRGLVSVRTSQNQKDTGSMSKSLKLGNLMNMRRSGKGSDLTKESPSTQSRRTKTNNLRKMQNKNRRMQGLLSFQSEEEPSLLLQTSRKKNELLRSEIIERQKKMGKLRENGIRSVSMVIGDEDKVSARKKLGSSHAKKRNSKKGLISVGKKMQKKIDFLKNPRNSRSRKTDFAKVKENHFKTHNLRVRNSMNTLPKKTSGKSYTSNNRARALNAKKRLKGLRQSGPVQKRQSHSRGAKKTTAPTKSGYLEKRYGKVPQKKRTSNSRKGKEESRRSIDNIYKRSQSSKQNKEAGRSIYQGKQVTLKKQYFTEQKKGEGSKSKPETKGSKKGFDHGGVIFENIYENPKGKRRGTKLGIARANFSD